MAKKKKKNLLPDKPSKLILVALEDLEWAEKNPKYRISMHAWHQPGMMEISHFDGETESEQEVCQVCFAGSVMAKTCKSEWSSELTPHKFPKELKRKLIALNHFRCGEVESGLSCLGVDTPLSLDANPWYTDHEMDEISADENRTVWKKQMRRMAGHLAKHGL